MENYMAIAFGAHKEYGMVLLYDLETESSEMRPFLERAQKGKIDVLYCGSDKIGAREAISGLCTRKENIADFIADTLPSADLAFVVRDIIIASRHKN